MANNLGGVFHCPGSSFGKVGNESVSTVERRGGEQRDAEGRGVPWLLCEGSV